MAAAAAAATPQQQQQHKQATPTGAGSGGGGGGAGGPVAWTSAPIKREAKGPGPVPPALAVDPAVSVAAAAAAAPSAPAMPAINAAELKLLRVNELICGKAQSLSWIPSPRLEADGSNFENVYLLYTDPKISQAIQQTYLTFSNSPGLSHYTLRELLLGKDLTRLSPDTKASQAFIVTAQHFYMQFENIANSRSYSSSKAALVVNTAILKQLLSNLHTACGEHY